MRILYVEDNEVNQALVERVLRAKKCSVVFREEGEGALEVLASDPDINLILLDIELAGSMNGLEVVRTMRARGDSRPVVAITAYAMMGDRERFLEAGCDQYLPKPLVITDLLNLIDDYEAQFAAKSNGSQPARVITTPGHTRITQTVQAVSAEESEPDAAPDATPDAAPDTTPAKTPDQVPNNVSSAVPDAASHTPPATPPEKAPDKASESSTKATTPALMPAVKPTRATQVSQPAEPAPNKGIGSHE